MSSPVTLGGRDCLDPVALRTHFSQSHPPLPVDWYGSANRYAWTVGLAPGRGSVILRRSDLDAFDQSRRLTGNLTLRFSETITGTSIAFPQIRIVGDPRCLDFGMADPSYLVPISDARIDLLGTTSKRHYWRYHPTDVIAQEDTDTLATASWAAVIADLWAELPQLGTFPGIPLDAPLASSAAFDRLDLHGFRVVDALEDALAAIGCCAVYDPVFGTYSIAYFGSTLTSATAAFVQNRGRLIFDESPFSPARVGPIPAKAWVLFPTWAANRYGRNPQTVYAKSVDRPGAPWAPGEELVDSVIYLQDFTPARLSADNTVKNTTTLETRASQVATIYYDRLRAGVPRGAVRQVYSGYLSDRSWRLGAAVDAMCWGDVGGGPVTLVARSALQGVSELYTTQPASSGVQTSLTFTPHTNADGTLRRAGGLPADVDRERDAWGWASLERGAVSAIGAGMGPLFRRGTALRQGEWTSIGTGGRTDHRGRLWRNWEDAGPDDMERFVKVTGAVQAVTVDAVSVQAYPGVVLQQNGSPSAWPTEEVVWITDGNGEALTLNRFYLCKQGTLASDGKALWAAGGGSGGATVTVAKSIFFRLPSALLKAEPSKANCEVLDWWNGTNPGATVTVYNMPANQTAGMFASAANNIGYATWDDVDSKYWIIQIEC